MNPCPCGYLTDADKQCTCTPNQIANYRGRLSGPLLDRVDMYIDVPKVPTEDFQKAKHRVSESSTEVQQRVQAARDIQRKRFQKLGISANSEMQSKDVKQFCVLNPEAEAILSQAVKAMDLSARSYYRILKLARTIADIAAKNEVQQEHILEALSYRKKEEH